MERAVLQLATRGQSAVSRSVFGCHFGAHWLLSAARCVEEGPPCRGRRLPAEAGSRALALLLFHVLKLLVMSSDVEQASSSTSVAGHQTPPPPPPPPPPPLPHRGAAPTVDRLFAITPSVVLSRLICEFSPQDVNTDPPPAAQRSNQLAAGSLGSASDPSSVPPPDSSFSLTEQLREATSSSSSSSLEKEVSSRCPSP